MAITPSNDMGKFVLGFIILIIGIVLLQATADETSLVTGTREITSETITITSQVGEVTYDNILSVTQFGNASLDWDVTADGFNFTYAGAIKVNTTSDGTFEINYTSGNENYVRDGTSRSLVDLIVIFFAIAVLAIAITPIREKLFEIMGK